MRFLYNVFASMFLRYYLGVWVENEKKPCSTYLATYCKSLWVWVQSGWRQHVPDLPSEDQYHFCGSSTGRTSCLLFGNENGIGCPTGCCLLDSWRVNVVRDWISSTTTSHITTSTLPSMATTMMEYFDWPSQTVVFFHLALFLSLVKTDHEVYLEIDHISGS